MNSGNVNVNIEKVLRQYISEELVDNDEEVGDDENLLADGMVDSMGMLRLVAFIDETWELRVPPEDFIIENFRTISDLRRYLTIRLGAEGAADHDG